MEMEEMGSKFARVPVFCDCVAFGNTSSSLDGICKFHLYSMDLLEDLREKPF